MDCWLCCGGRAASGSYTIGWIGAGVFDVEFPGRKCFPVLVWPQIVCLPQVVEECAGSSVGAQLLNPGLSELCHPDDCLMGLKNHSGKSKQYGKFVLPGLPGHMSYDSGSGLVSTLYTRHQHHVAPKFCAAVVFRRRVFLSLEVIWVWRCNQRVRSYG